MARYVVVENFKDGNGAAVYRRLRDQGRQMPAGLTYVDSWVAADLSRCFQIVDCDDEAVLTKWTAEWVDLVDFEYYPVITSVEARTKVLGEPVPTGDDEAGN